MRVVLTVLGLVALACGSPVSPSDAGTGGGGASNGGGTGGGGGAAGGGGGAVDGGGGAGGGGVAGDAGLVDLGWPFDASVPVPCPAQALDDGGGAAWPGWANFQHPDVTVTAVGAESAPVFGQVYQQGATEAPGPASGFEVQLLVGPFGSLPTGEGRCWRALPATFNVQVGNNDEYTARVTPSSRGLHGLLFRVRPPGGAWRYGDRAPGSDDGLQADRAGLLVATEPATAAPLVVATVNLQCRTDWDTRLPLVVRALARVDPDFIAFQEDCLAQPGGAPQADDVRRALTAFTRRGYEARRVHTHVGGGLDEGISLLSAHPVEGDGVVDLPYVHFPRKALFVDVTVRGAPLRFYATHFDFSPEAAQARLESAQAVLASLPTDRASLVAGDLNTSPEQPPVQAMAQALVDGWARANPTQPGLTFPASAPTRRIDYVFVSPAMGARVIGARVLDERDGATLQSDHFGVAVAVTVP